MGLFGCDGDEFNRRQGGPSGSDHAGELQHQRGKSGVHGEWPGDGHHECAAVFEQFDELVSDVDQYFGWHTVQRNEQFGGQRAVLPGDAIAIIERLHHAGNWLVRTLAPPSAGEENSPAKIYASNMNMAAVTDRRYSDGD